MWILRLLFVLMFVLVCIMLKIGLLVKIKGS